jgi:hypothetical protein
MTDHLSIALRSFLERNQRSALDVERTAGLPNATIARIFTGRHPRPETMSALLHAVPQEEAAVLLLAYLRDDCPDDWEDKIKLDLLTSHLAEPTVTYGTPKAATIEAALAALTHAAHGDENLRLWLINTAKILKLIPDDDR